MYALPWDTKPIMYPRHSARESLFKKPRPIELQSMFGTQVDSRRESPVGTVFANGPLRVSSRAATPRNVAPISRRPDVFSSPGPLEYRLVPSCGPQPLSSFLTASRVSLNQTEDRWKPMERLQRLNATPGPAAYFPR